jgi:hypothetical protein
MSKTQQKKDIFKVNTYIITYFYDPLVPTSTPENLVHSLGAQGRLDQITDGHGSHETGEPSSLELK